MTLATPDVFGDLLRNIIIAILILLIGFVAGKLIGLLFHKLFVVISSGSKSRGKRTSLWPRKTSAFISLFVYIVAVFFSLEQLHITKAVVLGISIFLAIIIAGAVIFVFVDFFTNAYFGVQLLASGTIEKGQSIKIKGINGRIEKIGLAHTRLLTDSDDIFIISNRLFFKTKFYVEKST